MRRPGLNVSEVGVNLCAFLDMLAYSEGTYKYPNDGYNTIVGGNQFTDYSKHPKVRVWFLRFKIWSTAAGRYQLLYRYWLAYCKSLKLSDFSPRSQDLIAVQQIRECGGLPLISNGDIEGAILKCKKIWASLPGAGYGQHENKMSDLMNYYKSRKSLLLEI